MHTVIRDHTHTGSRLGWCTRGGEVVSEANCSTESEFSLHSNAPRQTFTTPLKKK